MIPPRGLPCATAAEVPSLLLLLMLLPRLLPAAAAAAAATAAVLRFVPYPAGWHIDPGEKLSHPLLGKGMAWRQLLWPLLAGCAGIDCSVYSMSHSVARQQRCEPVGVRKWAEAVAAGSPVLRTSSAMVPGLQIGLCMHPAQLHCGVLGPRWGDQRQAVALGTTAALLVALGATDARAAQLAPRVAAQLGIGLPAGLDYAAVTQGLREIGSTRSGVSHCLVVVHSVGGS